MITAERLKELLSYDPTTGHFTWRLTKANAVAGSRAGCHMGPCRSIRIDGRLYREHRLAWLYSYGKWPVNQVDHINCDPHDNRLANLREATQSQNNANRRVVRKGMKGVVKIGRRFYARITCNNKRVNLPGGYDTEEEAHAAYVSAAMQIHGVFARAS